MNSHYHPYADISSPHPPSPDNNNYASPMAIGAGGNHHNGHGPMMNSLGGQQQGFHQLNNNNTMMNKCAGCNSEYTLIRNFSLSEPRNSISARSHVRVGCALIENDYSSSLCALRIACDMKSRRRVPFGSLSGSHGAIIFKLARRTLTRRRSNSKSTATNRDTGELMVFISRSR